MLVNWQYYKSVEFIDRDSICTLCLYRSSSLNIGDLIRYCHCQTDKRKEKQKEIIRIGIIGHLLFVFPSFGHLLSRLWQEKSLTQYGRTLKESFQEYGISRKRYAVFCICGHRCSASYALIKDYNQISVFFQTKRFAQTKGSLV